MHCRVVFEGPSTQSNVALSGLLYSMLTQTDTQLRFNEPIEAEFDPIEVYDEEGDRMDEDDARVSPNDARLLVADLEELPEGSYTVEWRVTSADGHPVDGGYGFAVEASTATGSAGEPIVPIERSAEQEETGSTWGSVPAMVLGVLLVGALVVAGLVMYRRKGKT